VDSISITVTGKLGGDPRLGTTKNGKAWASFSLAADVPSRTGGGDREFETRWYKVWCYGALAEHAAQSLVKGDRVTVRADDVSCRAWSDDSHDRKPRAQVELKAYDVAASMRFETLVTAKAARQGSAQADSTTAADPWTGDGQSSEVPDVLAGVTR
jgi:single-strand DNA-binding protein